METRIFKLQRPLGSINRATPQGVLCYGEGRAYMHEIAIESEVAKAALEIMGENFKLYVWGFVTDGDRPQDGVKLHLDFDDPCSQDQDW